ncbi:MAG: KH domain-containing protein [Anaerotardibacter sp.]
MAYSSEDIANLVRSLVTPLVDNPEEVAIYSADLEDNTVLIEVRVNEEDAGKVIGRQGRVIKAVRTLCRAAGSRNGFHVEVELVD